MGKRKERAVVLKQARIAPDIYDMWIDTALAVEAKPGQYLSKGQVYFVTASYQHL